MVKFIVLQIKALLKIYSRDTIFFENLLKINVALNINWSPKLEELGEKTNEK